MEQRGRAYSRPCRTGGAKSLRNVFTSLASMVGRDWPGLDSRDLPFNNRDMAYLDIQNPLDQCCAVEHSAEIEKWCYMWLLNTWNTINRTEQQDFEFYLILISFKWPHVANGYYIEQGRSSSWLLTYRPMKYPQSYSHVLSKPDRPRVSNVFHNIQAYSATSS